MANDIKGVRAYPVADNGLKEDEQENLEYAEWKKKWAKEFSVGGGRDGLRKKMLRYIESNNFISFEHFLLSLSYEIKETMKQYGLMDDPELRNEIERKKAFRIERYNTEAANGSREEQATFVKLNLPNEELTKIQTSYKNDAKKEAPKIKITFAEVGGNE